MASCDDEIQSPRGSDSDIMSDGSDFSLEITVRKVLRNLDLALIVSKWIGVTFPDLVEMFLQGGVTVGVVLLYQKVGGWLGVENFGK